MNDLKYNSECFCTLNNEEILSVNGGTDLYSMFKDIFNSLPPHLKVFGIVACAAVVIWEAGKWIGSRAAEIWFWAFF